MVSLKEKTFDSSVLPSYRLSALLLLIMAPLVTLGVSFWDWLSGEIVKNSIFVLGAIFLFSFVFFEQLRSGYFYFYRTLLLKTILLCAAFSLLSAIFSSNIGSSLGDFSPGFGSVAGAVSLFLFMYGVLSVFSRTKQVIHFYISMAVALVFFVFLQCVDFFFLSFVGISQETIAGQMLNLPIILGFTVLFFVSVLDFFPLGLVTRLILYGTLAGALFLLVIIPFPVVWEMLVIFLILSASFFLFTFHTARSQSSLQVGRQLAPSFPWHAVIFSALSLSLIFIGPNMASLFEGVRTQKEMIAEVRPSLSSSVSVLGGLYESSTKSLLLGVGGTLFSSAWNLYKPLQINHTPLWHTDFEVASSLLLTIVVTGGILGACTLLIFHGTLFFESMRFFFFRGIPRQPVNIYYLAGISFLLGGYSFVWSFFYFPNALLSMLGIVTVSAGIALSSVDSLMRWDFKALFGLSLPRSRAVVGVIVLLFLVLFVAAFSIKTASIVYYQKAKNTFLVRGDTSQAEILIKKALVLYPLDVYYRTLSEVKQFEVNKIIEQGGVDEKKTEKIRTAVFEGNEAAEQAVQKDRGNYLNWVVRGNGQFQHFLLMDRSAINSPEASYDQAIKLSPINPIPYYLKARLLAVVERTKEARALLQQALLLKPDYVPAVTLLREIETTK